MDAIPLIDLSATGPDSLAHQIEEACRDVGFMYVSGHGIPSSTIDRIRSVVKAYFNKSIADKLRDRITRDNYRGYIPTGFFNANVGNSAADNYEGYKLHLEIEASDPICAQCDLYGPNKWPGEQNEFRQSVLEYWSACDRVTHFLLGILASILGVDSDHFLQLFDKPLTNMTLLHYPARKSAAEGFGIHPHKDTDALTILAGDEVSGLQVKRRSSDEWIDAQPPAGALVVNIGDLLELWSGGYFVSTPHKVVNMSNAERYSFPYFSVPRFDTVVEPLRSPVPGFQRDPFTLVTYRGKCGGPTGRTQLRSPADLTSGRYRIEKFAAIRSRRAPPGTT